MTVRILFGDCRDVLKVLPDNSIDSIVTDPPYGLSFMGKRWDYDVPSVEIWAECFRVLKPGGHLLAFGGTRTYHRMACAIEDAGFEIRDQIGWCYGSGFPKSHNVAKAIDKSLGAEREVIGFDASKYRPNRVNRGLVNSAGGSGFHADNGATITAPATDAARQWEGWGTALKPAWEPIVVARKPLSEKSVAANVLEHGTGALNIDDCRIKDGTETGGEKPAYAANYGNNVFGAGMGGGDWENTQGRWPANLIHDGSDEVLDLFPDSNGSAARFFYCPKASKKDRAGSKHPTVKPLDLMRYLCRLVTPPGGTVLDPFAGSGTTGQAALEEGFRAVLIEREAEYIADIRRRLLGGDAA